jgi:TPR repeat protein
MMSRSTLFLAAMLVLATVLAAIGPAAAGPLEDGQEAYRRKNYTRAFSLLRPEAERGQARAQYLLGRLYEDGFGVEQNYGEAARWYRAAAEQGDPLAQHALSVFYAVGWGVAADPAESVKWLRRSAEQGYYYAENDLGSRYRMGRGVPQDDSLAYMWLDVAAENAPEAVKGVITKARDEVGQAMTPQAVTRAKELAARCRQSGYKSCG